MSGPNWLGLLKWTLATSDGTAPSEVRQMTDEDRAFLEKVMKEAVKDEPARMSEIINECIKLIDEHSVLSSYESVDRYLDELDDIIEQIDMAQIFVKFGGLESLLRMLELDNLNVETRSHISTVIGGLSQNNITVQDEMFQKGTIDRLSKVYISTTNVKLKTKIFEAMLVLRRYLHSVTPILYPHKLSNAGC